MEYSFFLNLLTNLKEISLPGSVAHSLLAPPKRMDQVRSILKTSTKIKKAAVLLLLYPNAKDKVSFVLTRRKVYNGVHSGQISFPGGKPEKQDVDLSQTAIRETYEEVGVSIKTIKIIRPMTEVFIPPSNFVVKPYIGYTLKTPNFTPQISEIDSIFEVSLKSILNSNNQKKSIVKTSYGPTISVPSFVFNGHIIWGATAMILIEIISLLNLINKK